MVAFRLAVLVALGAVGLDVAARASRPPSEVDIVCFPGDHWLELRDSFGNNLVGVDRYLAKVIAIIGLDAGMIGVSMPIY